MRQREAAAADVELARQSEAQEIQRLQDEKLALQDELKSAEAVKGSLSQAEADRQQLEKEVLQFSEQVLHSFLMRFFILEMGHVLHGFMQRA